MYERRRKESHRDTVTYEIDMLAFCGERLLRESNEGNDQYLYLEGFLLHFRNLIEFFGGKHHHHKDDLSIAHPKMWADENPSRVELDTIIKRAIKLDDKYHKEISKYLQHCTSVRKDRDKSWDVEAMKNEIEPIIGEFQKAFPRSRP